MTTAEHEAGSPGEAVARATADPWGRQVVWWDAGFVLIVLLTAAAMALGPDVGTRQLWTAYAAMAALLVAYAVWGAPAARTRDQRRAVGYCTVLVAGTTVAIAQGGLATFLLFGAFTQLWMLLEPPRRAVLGCVVLAAATTAGIAAQQGFDVPTLVQAAPQMAVALAFSVLLGLWFATTMRRSEDRARLLRELQDAQERLAESHHAAGVTAERERLAQEIHDTLAQGFTSVITQSQAAGAALDRDDAAQARDRLRLVEETARDNLAEARALVAAFAPVPLQGSTIAEALGRLADRFTAETGTRVRLEVAESAAHRTTGDAAADVVLLRAAQEALSNVRRHADAHGVVLRLDADAHPGPRHDGQDDGRGDATLLRLEVVDDGRGIGDRPEGIGLSGMRERVAAVGGTLDVGPAGDRGTRVRLRIPTGGAA